MNDPIRLLESSDEFARALLESASRDGGSNRARYRALATFGAVGLKLASSTAAASPSAFAASVAANNAATSGGQSLTVGLLAKWLGTGVVAGGVSVGGLYAIQAPSVETTASPATAQSPTLAPPVTEPVARTRASLPQIEPPASEPSRTTRELASAAASSTSTPTVEDALPATGAFPLDEPGSRLREELAALEGVRRSLRSGNPKGALAELARYEARFPRGALSQEATLLAVEARLDAGDTAGARAIAAPKLALDSTSPHARRLQALLSKKEVR